MELHLASRGLSQHFAWAVSFHESMPRCVSNDVTLASSPPSSYSIILLLLLAWLVKGRKNSQRSGVEQLGGVRQGRHGAEKAEGRRCHVERA